MNRISGQLPESIGKLQNLEILSLFNNEIEGHSNALFDAET
jgi:Leucine-rich repeat (LRR) protein